MWAGAKTWRAAGATEAETRSWSVLHAIPLGRAAQVPTLSVQKLIKSFVNEKLTQSAVPGFHNALHSPKLHERTKQKTNKNATHKKRVVLRHSRERFFGHFRKF